MFLVIYARRALLGAWVTTSLISGCALAPQQGDNSCRTVEVVELPATVCPEPKVVERVVTKTVPAPLPPMATTAGKLHLPIIGAVEWARIEPANLWVESRIDTGAETTSIHAEDIQLVERDGKRYVKFVLIDAVTGSNTPGITAATPGVDQAEWWSGPASFRGAYVGHCG